MSTSACCRFVWLVAAAVALVAPALELTARGAPASRAGQAARPDPNAREWIQLFNGRDLADWTAKFAKHDLGENFGNTFRVEEGLLKVRYDQWPTFNGEFGHLFYKDAFSYYLSRPSTASWASRCAAARPGQSATTVSCCTARTRERCSRIRIFRSRSKSSCWAAPAMGGLARPATSARQVRMWSTNGQLHTAHCTNSTSKTYDGEQWVRVEVLVHGDELVRHVVEGQTVLEYSKPQIGGGQVAPVDPGVKIDGTPMVSGYISLQAETAPVDFRKVELLNLEGCTDPRASTFKAYIVKSNPAMCK